MKILIYNVSYIESEIIRQLYSHLTDRASDILFDMCEFKYTPGQGVDEIDFRVINYTLGIL